MAKGSKTGGRRKDTRNRFTVALKGMIFRRCLMPAALPTSRDTPRTTPQPSWRWWAASCLSK